MLYALEDVPVDLAQVGGVAIGGVAIGGVADVYPTRPQNCDCACVQRGQTGVIMRAAQNMEGCNIAMKHGRRKQSMHSNFTTAYLLVGEIQSHPRLVVEAAAAHC